MLKQYGIQAADEAIRILEAEEDTTGTFFHVINRLDTALQKMGEDDDGSHEKETLELAAELGLDPADYPFEGELEFEINKRMA